MNGESIWVICGVTGCGKSALFNRLTGQAHASSDSAAPTTSHEDSITNAIQPTKILSSLSKQNILFVDCEGTGSALAETVAESDAPSNIAFTRILEGASGVIICLEPEGRANISDKLLILKLVAMCGEGVPIILCFTKCDLHTNHHAWFNKNRHSIEGMFHLNQEGEHNVRYDACFVGEGMDVNALVCLLDKPMVDNAQVRTSRKKFNVKPAVNPDRASFEHVLKKVVRFTDEFLTHLSTFDWWTNVLSFIPIIGTFAKIVHAIRNVMMGMEFGEVYHEPV